MAKRRISKRIVPQPMGRKVNSKNSKKSKKVVIERIESGIPGLDPIMEGGFVKGSANLVAGQTGTGKTIFCAQFLLHGIRNGEKCVYITLEEQEDEILADISRFGWDKEFREAIDKKQLLLISEFPSSIEQLKSTSFEAIRRSQATRFVLDSLSIATMGWKEGGDTSKIRREVFDFVRTLKKSNVTSLLITEIAEGDKGKLSRYGFEEFVADSVIILHYIEYATGGTPRSLIVRKMRRTNHGVDIYPLEISKNGVSIKKAI